MEESSILGAPCSRNARHHFLAFSVQDVTFLTTFWSPLERFRPGRKISRSSKGKANATNLKLF